MEWHKHNQLKVETYKKGGKKKWMKFFFSFVEIFKIVWVRIIFNPTFLWHYHILFLIKTIKCHSPWLNSRLVGQPNAHCSIPSPLNPQDVKILFFIKRTHDILKKRRIAFN